MLLLVVAVTGAMPASAAPPTVTSFTGSVTDVNLVTLTLTTKGGDSSGLSYIRGPRIQGFGTQDVGFVGQNGSIQFRAPRGQHPYTVELRNNAFETQARTVQVTVDEPVSPTVTSQNPARLSYFAAPQQVSFSLATTGAPTELRVRKPGGALLTTLSPVGDTASFTVPASDVGALPFGVSTYTIEACQRGTTKVAGQPWTNPTSLCGRAVRATIVKEASRFTGQHREMLASPQDLTVSWTGPGGFWYVFVDGQLLGGNPTVARSASLPAATLTPGTHLVQIVSCTLVHGCSNDHRVTAPLKGTVESIQLVPGNFVFAGPGSVWSTVVATVRTPAGALETVYSKQNGPVKAVHVSNGQTVNPGDPLVTLLMSTTTQETKEVIVGEGITWTSASWKTAFASSSRSYDLAPLGGVQNLIDVTFDDQGKLWALSEANLSVAAMKGATMEAHRAPLARVLDPATTTFQPVKPFIFGSSNRTAISETGERIINAAGKVWWVQGGGFNAEGNKEHNHSRIISFDPAGRDLPTTAEDERLCAINLPGGNNMAQSLAWDGKRMWFGEGKGGAGTPALGWFDPNTMPCGNFYDYDAAFTALTDGQPETLPPPETHPLCSPTVQVGCVHRIEMPEGVTEVTQIILDPDGSTVWFTDFGHIEGQIGSFRPEAPDATTGQVRLFPITRPARVADEFWMARPWQIRADERYVYFTSFFDGAIVRLDKAMAVDSNCQALVGSVNPCMTVAHLPAPFGHVNTHSIELQPSAGRLWFTSRGNVQHIVEDKDPATGREKSGSVVGFIDTATWSTGTVYTGLDELATPASLRANSLGLSGIAIHPTTGQIGLAGVRNTYLLDPL
jgi:hypothetical protein